jgi:hypothetical protein
MEGVEASRRKVGVEARRAEIVACKEEQAHVEGRAEQGEACTGGWPLQSEAGMWGLGSMVHTEREMAPVPVAEDVVGFAGSPPTLAGAGLEIEAAGGMAADGQDPLAVAVRGSRGAQTGSQIDSFEEGIEAYLVPGGRGERDFGSEAGIGLGAVEGHSG